MKKTKLPFIKFLFLAALIINVWFLTGLTLNQPVKAQEIPLLIKTADQPAVYFVSPRIGGKKLILNEKAFLSYGNKWSWIKTVTPETLNRYPEIKLVKTATEPQVYYLEGQTKRLIPSPQIFNALRFKWEEILTVNQIDLDSYQTGAPLNLNSFSMTTERSIVSNTPEKQLVISLMDDSILPNPVAPSGVWQNFFSFKLKAQSREPILITGLTVSLSGVNRGDQDFGEIYLTDETGRQYGRSVKFNQRQAFIGLNNDPIIVPAGGEKIIKVYGVAKQSGILASFGLAQADHILANIPITGQFPIYGPSYRLIDGTNLNAEVQAQSVILSQITREIKTGAKSQIITRFQLQETSRLHAALIRKIILSKEGNLPDEYLKNLVLVNERNQVIAAVSEMVNGQIIFDLSRQPYRLGAGQTENLTVRGDFTGGHDYTLKLIIKKHSDLTILSESSNYLIMVQGDFPLGAGSNQTANQIKITAGTAHAYLDFQKTSQDLVAGTSAASLAKFTLKSIGLNLNFNSFNLRVENFGSRPLTGEIIVKQGNQIIANYHASDFANRFGRIYFNREIIVKDGQSATFEILGTVDSQATNLDAYRLTLNDFNLSGPNYDYFGRDWLVQSDLIGVKVSQATVSPNQKYENLSLIAGHNNQLAASFNLQIGAAEDLILTSATIQELNNQLSAASGHQKVHLAINQRRIATLESPLSSPLIFNFKEQKLTRGRTYSLDIYLDPTLAADNQKLNLQLMNLILTGAESQAKTQISGLATIAQQATIKRSRLDFQMISLDNVNLTAGARNQTIGRFTISNPSAETININEIHLYEVPGSDRLSLSDGFRNLRLVLTENRRSLGRSLREPISGGNRLGGFNLLAGESLTIDILIDADSSASGKIINLMVQDIKTSGRTSRQPAAIIGAPLNLNAVEFLPAE